MKRFCAVVGLVAFLAACSDSTTTPVTHSPSGAAVRDGDPPPPPLPGSGDGSLTVGFTDASTFAATTTTTGSLPACGVGHSFVLNYTDTYLAPDPNNNQVVHLQLDGSPTSGDVTLHQFQIDKSKAIGQVADAAFAFSITDGTLQNLTQSTFSFSVQGTLTDLSTGFKCQASGELSGSLQTPTPE